MPTNPSKSRKTELDKTPRLSCDNVSYYIDNYSFTLSHKITDRDIHRSNYTLDWNEIVAEYLEVGIGDIAHFASQYVFAKALNAGRCSKRQEMQSMYLDIIDGIKEMIENGDLPLSA